MCMNMRYAHLLARRAEFLPMPMHFSKCGANLEATTSWWQLLQRNDSLALLSSFCPYTSNPGLFTIAVGAEPRAEVRESA